MKRMFLTAIALLAASAARAVVLAWTVDLTTHNQQNSDYKVAVLYAVHDSTEEALDSVDMDEAGGKTVHIQPPYQITDLGDETKCSSYSFFVQMFTADSDGYAENPIAGARSETLTYNQLGANGLKAIERDPTVLELKPWIIAFVPEPATAMLFCLGAAALALRRRRG